MAGVETGEWSVAAAGRGFAGPSLALARALTLVVVGLVLALPGHSEPQRYDPDREVCQVQRIRSGFQANLLPWEDQPLPVRQRLRQLQATMTLGTLRECQARGLLSADQVASLERELDLRASAAFATDAPEASQSPARP